MYAVRNGPDWARGRRFRGGVRSLRGDGLFGPRGRRRQAVFVRRQRLAGDGAGRKLDAVRLRPDEQFLVWDNAWIGGAPPAARLQGHRRVVAGGGEGGSGGGRVGKEW